VSGIRDGGGRPRGLPGDVDPHDPVVERLERYSSTELASEPGSLRQLRAELVNEYVERRIAAEPSPRSSRRRGWAPLRWAAVSATLIALLAGTSVVAAAEAGPGQPLYHVRLTIEDLTLPPQGEARVQALLSQLDTRLGEARDAGKRGDHGALSDAVSAYDDTLARLTDSAATAGSAGFVLDKLAKHEAILQGLLDQVPTQARQGLQHALDNARHARDAIGGRGNGQLNAPANGPGNGQGHGVGNPHNATESPATPSPSASSPSAS
jgi:hypothetical protein